MRQKEREIESPGRAQADRMPGIAGILPVPGARRAEDAATGWHSRHYLPHYDQPGLIQMITFRLADSLPLSALEQMDVKSKWGRMVKLSADDVCRSYPTLVTAPAICASPTSHTC
jgi:hypothetical protein